MLFEVKIFHEMLTVYITAPSETLLSFLDWVDMGCVELWEPSDVDFNGKHMMLKTERWRKRITKGLTQSIWCLGPVNSAMILKLRWHDEFMDC